MTTLSWLRKNVTTLMTMLLLTFGAAAPALADSNSALLKKILERDEIRIGVLDGFKPWSFRAPDGSMQGLTIELAKDVADTLGVKLTPVVVSSANRIQYLKQGRIDVIMAGMYDTAGRRKLIDIIEPAYWASGPTLLAKKGLITTWQGLRGKPVCVKQGVYYNSMVAQRFGAKLVTFGGNTEAKQALRSGKCVAWVYDDSSITATLASGDWDGYEMPVNALYANPWAAAVRKGEGDGSLGVLLSGKIYRWQSSGKLLKLAKKWDIQPADWLVDTHKTLKLDTSYLKEN